EAGAPDIGARAVRERSALPILAGSDDILDGPLRGDLVEAMAQAEEADVGGAARGPPAVPGIAQRVVAVAIERATGHPVERGRRDAARAVDVLEVELDGRIRK